MGSRLGWGEERCENTLLVGRKLKGHSVGPLKEFEES